MAAIIAIAGLVLTAKADDVSTISGFGTIPGAPANAYGGSGIPIDTSGWTVVSGIPEPPVIGPDPLDTLTLAMATTQHGAGNPAPGNNGAGTYTVSPGLVGGRSTWNFDFYVSSADNKLSSYGITLTELNVGNGETFSFNPMLIPDNMGGPASAGNSESLDFAVFGVPIGFEAETNDTYDFTLSAVDFAGDPVASTSITVVDGTGATVSAPDTASTAGLMAATIPLLALGKRYRLVPVRLS
jgi:hypothetical protein